MKQGAYDYLFKPLDPEQLRRVVGEALEVARRMQAPAASRSPSPTRCGRRDPRLLAVDARGLQGDRPRRGAGRPGADHRRERHRQGTRRPRHLPARRPRRFALPGAQLRRHPRDPAGERALRPREGRLHRRRAAPHRQVRAVPRRHPVPRRGRRHAAGRRRPRSCGCCRSRRSSGSAATRRCGPMSG